MIKNILWCTYLYACVFFMCLHGKAHLAEHTYAETKGWQQLSSIVIHLMI